MLGSASQEVMPGKTSGEVRLLRRRYRRSTVKGSPSSDKSILHLKDLQCQSADAGQSPSVASLAYGEASSGYAGQTKTVEKEHCRDVRCAHERREK